MCVSWYGWDVVCCKLSVVLVYESYGGCGKIFGNVVLSDVFCILWEVWMCV